jgi:hypothetical protein
LECGETIIEDEWCLVVWEMNNHQQSKRRRERLGERLRERERGREVCAVCAVFPPTVQMRSDLREE